MSTFTSTALHMRATGLRAAKSLYRRWPDACSQVMIQLEGKIPAIDTVASSVCCMYLSAEIV